MTTTFQIQPDCISDLFSQLLGNGVTVASRAESLAFGDHFVAAYYVNEEGNVDKLILCDCGFANRAGAALTMFPAKTAEDSINDGNIEEAVLENLSEVLNIGVNLLSDSTDQHLVLDQVVKVTDAGKTFEFSTAQSFDVDIEKYGTGIITVASVGS